MHKLPTWHCFMGHCPCPTLGPVGNQSSKNSIQSTLAAAAAYLPQSLKAAALGLNLTVANHVVLMDLWWNPTTEEQAIDRAHRIGQTRPVQVSRITVPGTVEERILELQVGHVTQNLFAD
eukprot:GHUV01038866.1.p1 GENE.GHUV01038866.1~~GHUV01038866.1.p1  ORF type:complete len:120 (+),score=30.05 GHUV01038866.1:31-390(+)